MKKIFALALAAVMTAGMTTVAFAAVEEKDTEVVLLKDAGSAVWVDADDDGKFELADAEKDQEDERVMTPVHPGDSLTFGVVDGGHKVGLPLFDAKTGEKITDKAAVKGYKVKAEWKVGDLDEKPSIELVKIGDTYSYAVVFTLPENAEVKVSDLAGEISVYKTSSQLKDTYKDGEYITVKIGSEYGYNEEKYDEVDWDSVEVVNFKGVEGEETMTFGDLFEFEVDVTGQGKLNLKNNTKFNEEFADMYDYANIDFITFEKTPRFNKIGTAYIYADEDAFIYEVTADGAKAIKGLEWDEDYEAWTFKTRTLGAYAISDVELDEKTVTETEDSSKTETETGKPNPDTGR